MNGDPHRDQPVLELGAPIESAAGALILLHGRGASAEDILGLAEEFYDPELAYLAPEAAAHAWYPNSFLAPLERNEPWLSSALGKVRQVVERTSSAGIPLHKTIIAGFSQGACLAAEFVARNPGRYGGVAALTGGLIGPPGMPFKYTGELAGTPVFFGSGDPDPHVPWERVQESAEVLTKLGAQVTLKRYPGMPHTVNRDEIEQVKRMIAASGLTGTQSR